jgi:DNA-binding XRE family transcriptional regulator
MMRGVLGGEPMDYPINPMYSAFVMCLNSLPEERQIAFYAVYIGNAYRNGKKVPIKSLASEIGVSRKAIYEWADNAAREVWGSALLHVALSKSLNREVEEFLD